MTTLQQHAPLSSPEHCGDTAGRSRNWKCWLLAAWMTICTGSYLYAMVSDRLVDLVPSQRGQGQASADPRSPTPDP